MGESGYNSQRDRKWERWSAKQRERVGTTVKEIDSGRDGVLNNGREWVQQSKR